MSNKKLIIAAVAALNLLPSAVHSAQHPKKVAAASAGTKRPATREPAAERIQVAQLATTPGKGGTTTDAGSDEAASVAPSTQVKFKQLTAGELKSTFMNFGATKEGRDPNSQVSLYGMVFADCLQHFKFENTSLNGKLKSEDTVGFAITDAKGLGRACMAKHHDASDSCSDEKPCRRISDIPGARIDLSQMGDVNVRLMHHDPNKDKDADIWESIPGLSNEVHKTAKTIREEQRAAAEAKKLARIERLQGQLNCRRNVDDITTARNARDLLMSMNVLNEDDAKRIENQLNRAEFNLLARNFKAVKANDAEGLAEAIEALKAFEAEHSEVADSIAVLFTERARAMISGPKADVDAYDKAKALIGEAQSLSGLNQVAQDRLDTYQTEASIGKMQKAASKGEFDWAEYQAQTFALQGQLSSSCNSIQTMNSAECRSTQSAVMALNKVPQQLHQAQYEKAMFQARMQQMQQQMWAMNYNNGMGGMNMGMSSFGGASQQQGSGFYK